MRVAGGDLEFRHDSDDNLLGIFAVGLGIACAGMHGSYQSIGGCIDDKNAMTAQDTASQEMRLPTVDRVREHGEIAAEPEEEGLDAVLEQNHSRLIQVAKELGLDFDERENGIDVWFGEYSVPVDLSVDQGYDVKVDLDGSVSVDFGNSANATEVITRSLTLWAYAYAAEAAFDANEAELGDAPDENL